MVNHYKDDKDFIYGLDIKHADAIAQPQVLRETTTWPATHHRNKANPAQVFDIVFVVVAIFVALWLPLKLGLAGAAKAIDKIDAPDLGDARPERHHGRDLGKARLHA